MAYVRMSLVRPRHGQEREVERLLAELTRFAKTQPGCIDAFLLKPQDQSGEIGRIALYESAEAADHVAATQHALSIRSELHSLIEAGHEERTFFTMEP